MLWFKKHLWLILSLIVAIFAGRALLTGHHFYTHDDLQVFRVNQYLECFKRGQIPCRWAYDLGKGYGEPWFNYYPPMIYLAASLIHVLGFSIITSLNLLMFLSFLLAGWGMYSLIQELAGKRYVAFLGSSLFTLYPFHATNVFLRGVYAENLAWSLTPFILLLLYRQIKHHQFAKFLPILLAVVLLTHVIGTFIVIGFSLIWTILVSVSEKQNILRNLARVTLQIGIAIALSAFFFLPAMLEKNLVQSDTLIQGYYAFTNHFVSLAQLFKDYTWNYGASYFGTPAEEMGFMVGHVHTLLLGVLLVVTGLTAAWKKQKSLIFLAAFSLTGFIFTLLLSHQKSIFIWNLLPPLAYVQFPWRFIGWAGIPLVITLSLLLSLIPEKLGRVISIITLLALLSYSYPFFMPRQYDDYQDRDFIAGSLMHDQQTKSLYDYLPSTVKTVPESFAADSVLSTPIFYFPGWTSQQEIKVDPQSGIILESGSDLTWKETSFRLAMDFLSLTTLLAYGLYLLKSHVQ